jgi:cutinase
MLVACIGGSSLAAPQGSMRDINTCSPLELVWARGTVESQSSFGVFVGDSYTSQLHKAIPEMTFYNVVYPASGSSTSPDEGVKDTLRHLNARMQKCALQK